MNLPKTHTVRRHKLIQIIPAPSGMQACFRDEHDYIRSPVAFLGLGWWLSAEYNFKGRRLSAWKREQEPTVEPYSQSDVGFDACAMTSNYVGTWRPEDRLTTVDMFGPLDPLDASPGIVNS